MSKSGITKQKYTLLYHLLSMREEALLSGLPKVLMKYYEKSSIHATQDYIYALGEIPVTLIAHLDTIYCQPPTTIYHDPEHSVIWTPQGLGADDRAGVFAILHILEQGYRPSIIFTSKEEVGGLGAQQIVFDFPFPLVETYFLIELDRQGTYDAVYYDCGNRDFERFISSFGFITNIGSFSDIAIIGAVWNIASVNLSIGYVNEHSPAEMLFYQDMFNTIKKVEAILENCGNKQYDYQAYCDDKIELCEDCKYEQQHGYKY